MSLSNLNERQLAMPDAEGVEEGSIEGIAASNNNAHMVVDAIINQAAESAMLSTTTFGMAMAMASNGIPTEVPKDELRFPLLQLQSALMDAFFPQRQQQLPEKEQQRLRITSFNVDQAMFVGEPNKFPWQSRPQNKGFPLNFLYTQDIYPANLPPKFPLVSPKCLTVRCFPADRQFCLLDNYKNFNYLLQTIARTTFFRPPPSVAGNGALTEFPIIKKQFLNFPNTHKTIEQSNRSRHDDVVAVENENQNKAPTTTMTQASHDKGTKIAMDSQANIHYDDDDDDQENDNELKAHEQTFNLKDDDEGEGAVSAVVVAGSVGVGKPKEIEHQQAENFNDAFRQQRQRVDDAMDAAKKSGELYEQSKLEKEEEVLPAADNSRKHNQPHQQQDHNELNMTKALASKNLAHKEQQQSICLAEEQPQTIDGHAVEGAAIPTIASNHQHRPAECSDARESSSEQVEFSSSRSSREIAHQILPTTTSLIAPPELLATATRQNPVVPNIEILKSAVRAFLNESSININASSDRLPYDLLTDIDLIELLSDVIDLITCSKTGNLLGISSPEQLSASDQFESEVQSECAAMTLTKVGEDSETAVVGLEIYAEQPIDEPVDDNNNNSGINNNNHSEEVSAAAMKYELKPTKVAASSPVPAFSNSTRAPTTAPASRHTASLSATPSRIRDVPTPTSSLLSENRHQLSDLRRSSSSLNSSRDDIDVESVLPERTRLRRQRRMRSQDSVEEKPEDVIERLNKLKARISGALSEVKGVLKQYSTESEAEAAGVKWEGPPSVATASSATVSEQTKEPETDPEPAVKFRFIKKVRRRSCFDEAEEDQAHTPSSEIPAAEKVNGVVKEEDHPIAPTDTKKHAKIEFIKQVQKELLKRPELEPKVEPNLELKVEPKVDPHVDPLANTQTDIAKSTVPAKVKPEDQLKVDSEVEPKVAVNSAKEESKEKPNEDASNAEVKDSEVATIAPAQSATQLPQVDVTPPPPFSADASAPANIKKKITVKTKNSRRASIAAVEGSKIEPAVQSTLPLVIRAQRRPSDSEAIVKRKKKEKLATSGNVDIASPKLQLVSKAKRAATTDTVTTKAAATATATNEQLVAATTAKVSEESAKRVVDEAAAGTTIATATSTTATTVATATAKISDDNKEETTTAKTAEFVPKRSQIDATNQTPAIERSRRASLKLAELVGETVLVPATPIPTPSVTTTIQDTETLAIISPLSESKELINQVQIIPVQADAAESEVIALASAPQQVAIIIDIGAAATTDGATASAADSVPQIAAALNEVSHDLSSSQQQQLQQQVQQQATKTEAQTDPPHSVVTMPELKVLTGPVQPVKIETVEPNVLEQQHDSLVGGKKKTVHLKKLVRKNSIDKEKSATAPNNEKVDANKLNNILKDKNKISGLAATLIKATPPKKQTKASTTSTKAESAPEPTVENIENDTAEAPPELATELETIPLEEVEEPAPVPPPKKPRKIKKKVIIKRQKRRLSIGDSFFIQPEPEEPIVPEVEIIEKAISYVTDDENNDVEEEPAPDPPQPLKSCMHVREYKIGDLVLYAERYRKTQVRWKRGRVLERITSISYKLDIEGKEVPAHISYIKKYTGRKVKFVDKEYLEIDYEQVAEEERRARSYSIWNMV